ncbi:HET-domain-containing protein [Mycena venus]|uniref:HET-domain-containing protein n=1 Tax=Mycena venus TaxID=2733690 RepID=A0A8H7D8W1_9AGAR|nr:HET-domain-containing protein [Mycena venus]
MEDRGILLQTEYPYNKHPKKKKKKKKNSQKAMDPGNIHINVERMNLVGGTGGLGGQATHSGTGGSGGLGEGARIFHTAQNVTIHNHSDSSKILDTELEAKLEKWLNAPDPKEKQLSSYNTRNRSPCSWFFQDTRFIYWQNTPGKLLWIQGPSGTGKTIISSMIIHQLIEDRASSNGIDSTAIAYFYFDFTDSAKQSVEKLVHSLVLQLSHQSPAPYVTLAQKYDLCKGQTIPPYSELLTILEELMKMFSHTYFILDALDECADHDHAMNLIKRISFWSDIQVHILVTSQPRDVFETKFLSLKILVQITIQADTTSHDIELYISKELASKSELQIWKSEWAHITNYITHKSAGMFRLAYCLLEQLKECVRLDDLQEALDALPDNLHDIYARSLISVPKKHLPDVQRLLHWLVFSEQPLTLAQLEDTIAFDFSNPKCYKFNPRRRPKRGIFLKWLLVLVSIEPSRQGSILNSDGFYHGDCTVTLVHSSVRDYLLLEQEKHPSSCLSCPIHVTGEAAHQLMAQSCVCYLLHFANNPLNEETFPNYPLAMYAAKNWSYHLLHCRDRTGLSHLTMDLLESGSNQYAALNHLSWRKKQDGRILTTPNWSRSIDAPLYLCAGCGYIEGVKLLLDRGADVNAKGVRHGAMWQAIAQIQSINEDAVFPLFQINSKFPRPNDPIGTGTALQAASATGQLEIVRLLLQNGADINMDGEDGAALQVASKEGHVAIVRLLLENRADINAKGENGTALQLASQGGHISIVQLLLKKGADINADGHLTALQAASEAGHLEIVCLLLEKGAHANAPSRRYGTALQLASGKSHIDIVRLLLEKGADVNAEGGNSTALQLASYHGHIETVRLLLERGADVNAREGRFGTALQCASRTGHIEIVHLLLEKGAKVNAQSQWDGTALQLASENGHIEIVHLLLEKGTDVNAQGRSYGTAWQRASEKGHTGIVNLLLQHGATPSLVRK